MDKDVLQFKENVDSWVKEIRGQVMEFTGVPAIVEENYENIQHNYELIFELKEEIDRLREEMQTLRLEKELETSYKVIK